MWCHPFLSNKANADELNVVFSGIFLLLEGSVQVLPHFGAMEGHLFALFQERLGEKQAL